MTNITDNTFSFPFKDILVDEVALGGLEGVGIEFLWKRIAKRISSPVTEKMQCRFWNVILKSSCINLYENPIPIPRIDVVDRFTIVDELSGDLKEPDDCLDGPYEYNPIENENGCEGSCVHYKERILLKKDKLSHMSYKDMLLRYSDTLVLVASREERWTALAGHLPISYAAKLTKLHYCILELVGKSRENGQMTVGKSNLAKLVKDSKLLFYNRKILQQLDLVRVTHITQVVTSKGGSKAILLRLRRFHKSAICSVPKCGWIHSLIEHLRDQPNYCESTELVLKKGLLSQKQNKRFQKKSYIFGFEERPINVEEVGKKRERVKNKRRYIYLSSVTDDESSESEDEEQKTEIKCQYKVGVNLLRQAYERFLEAGLTGLTQIELGQLLGVEFYISRTICRIFRTKNLVREFLEDKGRQRTARFIAVAATAKMDIQYAEEKEKFLKYVDECVNLKTEDNEKNYSSDSDEVVPRKKIKLENISNENYEDEDGIFEINTIPGLPKKSQLLDSGKKFSLRQLKFATGALKIVKEKQIVVGYQELGRLIAADIKEPPMDTKALKTFLQRLINDGCIKIFGIKWPGYDEKYTTIICAPTVKPSHPFMQAKYKSIIKNSRRNIEQAKKRLAPSRPLTLFSFPRYMKLQKLHEVMYKCAYLDDVKTNESEKGFVGLKDLIPELTLEMALGTISSAGIMNVYKFNINDDLLETKLRELPEDLFRALTATSHLAISIRANLKVLATFGLIQLIATVSPSNANILDNSLSLAVHVFYVNKHATILDTSGVWPKKNMDSQNLEKKFNFKTFEDVKDFWSTAYNISTNTTIEVPNRRQKNMPAAPIRSQNEVEKYDKGIRFGDSLGPCGFDSAFYLDIPRLWKAYTPRTNKITMPKPIKKQVIKIPKNEKPKKKVLRVKKKAGKKTKLQPVRKSSLKQPLLKQPMVTRKKVAVVEQIKWTSEDDIMIMLCRTAITIMSPVPQPGSLQVRNLVIKDILSIRDPKKNQKICHRRAAIVDNNSTMIHLKNCIMAELKHHNSIMQKYDGMLKKLRILNPNVPKYLYTARIPMMELVWVLLKVLDVCSTKQIAPIFTNLEDFKKKYKIAPSSNQIICTYKSAPDDFDLGPLKESVMLIIMLSHENTVPKETAKKIYSHFKKFDETILSKAVVELRHSRAIAAKEKVLNGLLHKVNLDDIVDCWFKISTQYQRKWQNRLNAEFADDLGDSFDMSLMQNDLNGSPEINCFVCELEEIGVINIQAVIAPYISGFTGSMMQEDQLNSIDIESKYKLKSGTYGWSVRSDVKKFTDVYEGIDIEEPLLVITRDSVMRHDDVNIEPVDETKLNDTEKKIILHLQMKAKCGSNYHEIKEITGLDTETLMKTLTTLISNKIIKRVGLYDNVFVMMQYIEHWCMDVNSYYILSKPWLTIDGEMRKEIFIKWAGVIVNKVFECPGSTFSHISDTCEYLTTAAVQDVCEVLNKWGCVSLHTMIQKKVDLFTEDDDVVPEIIDYNIYDSPQNIVVMPVPDSLVRYSFVRKSILNAK